MDFHLSRSFRFSFSNFSFVEIMVSVKGTNLYALGFEEGISKEYSYRVIVGYRISRDF